MNIQINEDNDEEQGSLLDALGMIPNKKVQNAVGSMKKIRTIIGIIVFIAIAVYFVVKVL